MHQQEASPEQMLHAHWPLLARVAASYVREPARRDDLLQDIGIAVWQALPQWRGEGSLRAYIARVAHNRAVDALMHDKRQPSGALDEDLADPQADPVRHAQTGQRRDDLLQAVRRLPLGYRQVVSLSLEGFSNREVGQALGLEENTVAQRLSRARKQLRVWMEEK